MNPLQSLLGRYDRLVILDTETTGLSASRDEIIEFAAAVVENREGRAAVTAQYDQLVALSPGGFVPARIEALTGISTRDLRERGLPKTRICRDIGEFFQGNALLLAYNAHFDLTFLYYLLLRSGDTAILRGKDKLDLLTVFRDRRTAPHKLRDAIRAYGLTGRVANTHRALDDVLAALAVLEAMADEQDDLLRYVNLFGYPARFGMEGKPISSVTYRPQTGYPAPPLYHAAETEPLPL